MKLQALADKLLKCMAYSYHQSGRDSFDMDYFVSLFPRESSSSLSNALYLLDSDDLVHVFRADGIAYTTTLLPQGIQNCEENTMLKKGYLCIKEVVQLIS